MTEGIEPANDREAPVTSVPVPSTRKAEDTSRLGKEFRRGCPRSSHSRSILGQTERDPLALLEESNRDRVENLLPIRFTRMAESSLAFFRGTAILQAHDLQGTPSAGITVQCCGDCHLMNFGGFATPERARVFDINDFDETHPGPFEWDVKRLATSFVLAARWRDFSAADARRSAEATVVSYRDTMARFAGMSALDTWYAKITVDDLLQEIVNDPVFEKRLKKRLKEAAQNTSEHVFQKLVTMVDGKPRIAVRPPLLFRDDDHDDQMENHVAPFFANCRSTLSADRQVLFDRYRVVDAAHKVVGVGSVGTRCYIALLLGPRDDPLFLQVKEARPSVLEGRAAPSAYTQQGERVVIGQRLMQSASDIFLGWTSGPGGRDFYVRQLRDMKFSADLTNASPRVLAAYGDLCGRTLARAHAKGADAALIAGYLGSGSSFPDAITDYAVAYADQVEKDYHVFRAAVRAGRFPTETLPSQVEQAIR